ncbi:MAG TPA: hypothetical protein VFH78_01440 [Candidatus Thermoplasmatota archaeon]|nr:hypothetical protein [Candidatus Thermoplasmatota archaeon]
MRVLRAGGRDVADESGVALGECSVPPAMRCRETDLPKGPVTFGEAERAWRGVTAGVEAQGGPTAALWGVGQAPCTPADAGPMPDVLRRIEIGRSEWADQRLDGSTRFTKVRLDADTGETVLAAMMGVEFARGVVSPAPGLAAPPGPRAPAHADARVAAAVGMIALALAALVYAWHLAKFGVVALFSRLTRARVLDHGLRAALIAAIRAAPGITPPRLQEATGAGWSTIVYHLDVLERNRLVVSTIDGRHRRYFAVGQLHASDLPKAAVLANANTRAVHDLVRAQPGIRRGDIAELMGWTGAGAMFHLRRLQRAGLVQRAGPGRFEGYVSCEAPAVAAAERGGVSTLGAR